MKQLPTSLSCVFLACVMLSCKKEKESVEIKDLEFVQETYFISEGTHDNILITNGNKKYSVSDFDEELIVPMVSITDFPAGSIYVNALKKGTTALTVKDDVSGQEAQLTIHVVDPFLAMKVGDILPIIKNEDYETGQAIRDQVRSDPQRFFELEKQEVLVLQQNADNQFWLFKNEEDAARGVIHASGEFTLDFSFAGPNRLRLDYDNSTETVEYGLYTPDQATFSTLLQWVPGVSKSSSIGPQTAEVPQNTTPVEDYSSQLFLITDVTSFFNETHPNVERVELFQQMSIYGKRSGYVTLANGILN